MQFRIRPWPTWVWVVCFSVLFVFAFRGRLFGLWNLWWTHGLSSVGALIPPVSATLIWRKRKKLEAMPLESSAAGLIPVFLATAGASTLPSTGLLFATYWGGVALLLGGFRLLRELIFPLALLIFVVPIPLQILNILDYPLQMLTAQITADVGAFVGLPVIQQGPTLSLPNTQIFIAPACNGLRSVAALFLIALVASHISRGSLWARTLLPVIGIGLAYVSNLLRLLLNVIITNALGSSSWLEYEQTYDLTIGFLVFVIACIGFSKITTWLKCRPVFASVA